MRMIAMMAATGVLLLASPPETRGQESSERWRQEVRAASMGFAHGRNDDKSPRPDCVRDGSVSSYGRAGFL